MSNETIRNCSTYETKPGTFDFVVKNGFEQIDCFIGLEGMHLFKICKISSNCSSQNF